MEAKKWQAVVMGGSAGALDALSVILSRLPEEFSLPILIVVHVPSDKKSMLPEVLQSKCDLPLREAEDKEPLLPGRIYLAPPDYHLLVENDRHLALSYDQPLWFSRPSIDVLFESAADVFGGTLIGVLLSGANEDGAQGLRMIEAEGGVALVQSPAEAGAREMPLAAIRACREPRILQAVEIAKFLTAAAEASGMPGKSPLVRNS